MSVRLVSMILLRATRCHMRSQTEGLNTEFWVGGRETLLAQASMVSGHPRELLYQHVVALAQPYMGLSLEVGLDELRNAETIQRDLLLGDLK